MDGPGPLPDSPRETAAILLIAALVLLGTVFAFTMYTNLDAHARFVLTEPDQYFSTVNAAETDTLTFSREDISRINWASAPSLGPDPRAEEKLYCFSVTDGRVTKIELVHETENSDQHSVSGRCFQLGGGFDVDGFLHTHPDHSDELSDEDRDVESDISYSCLQFAEAAASPFGRVDGIRCWSVEGVGDSAEFTEIPVTAT